MTKTKNLVMVSLFIAIGIILQVVESSLPVVVAIPGGKLGLANIVTILNITILGASNSMIVAIIRAFLGSLLFSGASSVMYSVCGALLSTIGMIVFERYTSPKFSLVSVGVIGGVLHNIAQIAVASVSLGSIYIWSYLPVLMIIGAVSGVVTGLSARLIRPKINIK